MELLASIVVVIAAVACTIIAEVQYRHVNRLTKATRALIFGKPKESL